MRLSDHDLFPSEEELRRALRDRLVPPARASWLGAGVDLRRFDPAAVGPEEVASTRAAWGVPEGAVVVGSVARLARGSGIAELVRAAAAVRRERADVAFVIVGPPEPTAADGLSAAELDRVRAAGVILAGEGAWDDLPTIHAALDVFVLASHRAGMPRSLIEASAMARPVIATDVPGCREVVDPGVTGTLIPPRDDRAIAAAVRAAVDAPNRAAVGEAGRRRALDRFDEDGVVERTLQVYRRLLRQHGIRWDGEQPAA
jgi:glycosyltransferase involved in cell wall biosynthesis